MRLYDLFSFSGPPSAHGPQQSFTIPSSASALERTQLDAYIDNHLQNLNIPYGRGKGKDPSIQSSVVGPSAVDNGRATPVSLDLTEGTGETVFRVNGYVVSPLYS